jgi:hypothetical protein
VALLIQKMQNIEVTPSSIPLFVQHNIFLFKTILTTLNMDILRANYTATLLRLPKKVYRYLML